MISPHTPPGTQVCCIDDTPGHYGPVPLTKGSYYTVKEIVNTMVGATPFGVFLEEVNYDVETFDMRVLRTFRMSFSLARFRYIELPKTLNCLLEETKIKELA